MTRFPAANGGARGRSGATGPGDRHPAPAGATQGHTGAQAGRFQRLAELHFALAEEYAAAGVEGQDRLAVPGVSSLMSDAMSASATPELDSLRNLLSVNDLAERLAVDPKTIRRWRRSRKLPPAIEIGGVVRWRPEAIEAWLREQEDAA